MSPASGPTSSGVAVATVLRTCAKPFARAVRASAWSAPGQISPDMPSGATPIGAACSTPNSVVRVSGSITPFISWGRSSTSSSADRLRCIADSSPVPLARYSQLKWGSRRFARRSRSSIAGKRSMRSAIRPPWRRRPRTRGPCSSSPRRWPETARPRRPRWPRRHGRAGCAARSPRCCRRTPAASRCR